MNFIQRLLGIDRIIAAVSSEKRLQTELSEAHERNRRHEEEIAQLRQQLLQKNESQSKEITQAVTAQAGKPSEQSSADKQTIAELKEQCRKLSEALSDPQAVFHAYLQENAPTEEKKGRGRPRIDGKNINLRLDLDLSIITEEVANTRGKSVTSVLNEAVRYYLSSLHADMFTRLAQPRGREYQPFDPIGE